MSEVTYDDALKFFKGQTDLWEAFCKGIEQRREHYFGDVKACMETPTTMDHNYFAANGKMIAIDDLLFELRSENESQ